MDKISPLTKAVVAKTASSAGEAIRCFKICVTGLGLVEYGDLSGIKTRCGRDLPRGTTILRHAVAERRRGVCIVMFICVVDALDTVREQDSPARD